MPSRPLQRVYVGDMSRIPEGKLKYSAMCNEDGCLLDDGVVAKLGENDYYFTTSTNRTGGTGGVVPVPHPGGRLGFSPGEPLGRLLGHQPGGPQVARGASKDHRRRSLQRSLPVHGLPAGDAERNRSGPTSQGGIRRRTLLRNSPSFLLHPVGLGLAHGGGGPNSAFAPSAWKRRACCGWKRDT